VQLRFICNIRLSKRGIYFDWSINNWYFVCLTLQIKSYFWTFGSYWFIWGSRWINNNFISNDSFELLVYTFNCLFSHFNFWFIYSAAYFLLLILKKLIYQLIINLLSFELIYNYLFKIFYNRWRFISISFPIFFYDSSKCIILEQLKHWQFIQKMLIWKILGL